MMVYKAFCKSVGGGIGRSIACREGKAISIVSDYGYKMPPLTWWKWFKVINLPPGSWLITPKDYFLQRCNSRLRVVSQKRESLYVNDGRALFHTGRLSMGICIVGRLSTQR